MLPVWLLTSRSPDWFAGRGRPPQAAARRAGLEGVEKRLPAMMRLGALGGWSDPKSHRLGALKLICRPVAGGHPGTHQLGDVT
jgi:hypothetical protein